MLSGISPGERTQAGSHGGGVPVIAGEVQAIVAAHIGTTQFAIRDQVLMVVISAANAN